MPDAVVLRSWLPTWIWSVAVFTAVIGLIGILATRHWAFVVVAFSGLLLVGIGNAAAGAARVALDGPRLAVRPVARWHGPFDLRTLSLCRLPTCAVQPNDLTMATRRGRGTDTGRRRRT